MAISTRSTNFGTNSVRICIPNRFAPALRYYFSFCTQVCRVPLRDRGGNLAPDVRIGMTFARSRTAFASVLAVVAPCNPTVILFGKSVLIILKR